MEYISLLLFGIVFFKAIGYVVTECEFNITTSGIYNRNSYKHVMNLTEEKYNFATFGIQTKRSAYVGFRNNDHCSDKMYEILIGGYSQQNMVLVTAIRRMRYIETNVKQHWKVIKDTPNILDDTEFRTFWTSYNNGTIKLGKGTDPNCNLVIEYSDTDPHSGINNLAVSTRLNSTGEWCFFETEIDFQEVSTNVVTSPSLPTTVSELQETDFQDTSTKLITSSTLLTATSELPLDLTIYPDYGPVSGGTTVNITGGRLDAIMMISFGDIQSLNFSRYGKIIYALTPPYNNIVAVSEAEPVDKPFKVTVYYNDGQDTGLIFTYKPDPEVVDIYPRKITRSGGNTVTVKGSNLDSVATPMLTVTAIKRSDRHQSKTFHSPCTVETSQQLKCVTPQIPKNPFDSKRKRHTNLRLRRQSNDDDLDFLLGLQFDGATDYENLTDNLPHLAHVEVHPNPSFSSGQMFSYDPESAGAIAIKGEDIDAGVVVADYEVLVGKAVCTNVGITRDKLYCNPPLTLDEVTDENNTARAHNEADVVVRVGATLEYEIGYIVYDINETIPLYTVFAPVVAALGAPLIVFVIILIVCCCRKVRAKKDSEKPIAPSARDLDTLEPSENNNYYTGETQPKSQYYMVVNQGAHGQRNE